MTPDSDSQSLEGGMYFFSIVLALCIGVKFWKIQSKMGGPTWGGLGGLGGLGGATWGGLGGPLGGLPNISRFLSSETKSGIY